MAPAHDAEATAPVLPATPIKFPTVKAPAPVQVTPVTAAVRAPFAPKVMSAAATAVPPPPAAATTPPVAEDSGRLTVPEYPVPAVPTVMVGAPEEPAHIAVMAEAWVVAAHCPKPDKVAAVPVGVIVTVGVDV